MFLNAVVLILQEILEAALLIGVLMVLTGMPGGLWGTRFQSQRSWLLPALLLGLAGAWLYAAWTPAISEWFDYVGQEVSNSLIHLLSLGCFLVLVYLPVPGPLDRPGVWSRRLALAGVVMIVFLALVREGSEIIIYLAGLAGQPENFTPAILGGFVGAGIGVSCGVLLYYGLVSLNPLWTLRGCVLLIALICGNMASQVVMLLTQADWLPYTAIAWDTTALIAESSLLGRLLYALLGYEATPSILQAVCYLLGVAAVLPSPLARKAWSQPKGFSSHDVLS